ncbi:TRAP transporter large permease [Celeribacter indicus]|uniref:TRAP transporter large permease protein n=1 Tax=Celeribacter indicus TaxID=1208324 RepID=A0A0B5DVZ1_9RHOB|nr:TRAP transporter large permease subunit [Celeribacter indicus]AJE47553.1 Putative TRAP transporter large permease protein [Celeribacter indicus]SDW09988.1 TRAP transporter, DctM subunit [Celeribacter indicus]
MAVPATFILTALAVLLLSGTWIGLSLMGTGILSLELFRNMRVGTFLASDIWGTATSQELVTLPLFVLMGELLYVTNLSRNLFDGLAPFARRLPGGLIQVNVLASALFAAISGSSAATTATVGRITVEELDKRGFDPMLNRGSLAGAGSIGLLIPPSIPMIVYGVIAQVSILDLFIAGLLPGLLLCAMFMAWIGLRSRAPDDPDARPLTFRQAAQSIGRLLPTLLLILCVMGSMLTGLASVTEAAAVGSAGALVLLLLDPGFRLRKLTGALMSAVRTCSMISLILAGALFLTKAMARLSIPSDIAQAIEALHLSPFALIALLVVFYLVLGCVIDGLSTIVMTLPVTLPLAVSAGFDPVWYGIFLIVTIEMAQITPPVGINLFVMKHLTGDPIGRLARAAAPFCLVMILHVFVLTLFPQIATWLPQALK